MEQLRLHELWAKTSPYQSLITHSVVCGTVARTLYLKYLSAGYRAQIASKLGLGENRAADFIAYLASVHDIGKIDERFQYRLEDPVFRAKIKDTSPSAIGDSRNVRHEKIGRESLRWILRDGNLDRKTADLYGDIIGAHHQGKDGSSVALDNPSWAALRSGFESAMRDRFWGGVISSLPVPAKPAEGLIAALLLGPVILADWISSGLCFADAESWIDDEGSEEKIIAKTIEFLELSGMSPKRSEWGEHFTDVWPNIATPRPLQSELETLFADSAARCSLLLIEAPMGEGKTEAGLYAATQLAKQWGKDGVYVALPTSATSNQMLGRMRDFFAMHGIEKDTRLLHSMAWLVDDATPEWDASVSGEENEVRQWLSPLRRGLLSQYAVGTVDQAMMAATIVKYGVLRLMGLAEKVLVIDEIHSYDVFMSSIIEQLMRWCRALEIPVVMLSATLPPKKKQELLSVYTNSPLSDAYPLLTAVDENGNVIERVVPETVHRQTCSVTCVPILKDAAAAAKKAVELTDDGGCICVLMNTVAQAQAVYEELCKIYNGDRLLFHAQFPAGKRSELEKKCIARYGKDRRHRPKRSILVATQVVEQSLDVDFDAMLTAIAPIDLLLQRMGRIHRHEGTLRPDRLKTPQLYVMIPGNESGFDVNGYVYPTCFLKQSVHLLVGRDTIRVPEDLAPLVAQGYDPGAAPPEEYQNWLEQYIEDEVKSGISKGFLLSNPEKKFTPCTTDLLYTDEESGSIAVRTRLGEPTMTISLLEEEELERLKSELPEKDGRLEIRSRITAKRLLQSSLSVRLSRLKRIQGLRYTKGGKLLEGVWLIPLKDGKAQTDSDKLSLYIDEELGLMIKEGKP